MGLMLDFSSNAKGGAQEGLCSSFEGHLCDLWICVIEIYWGLSGTLGELPGVHWDVGFNHHCNQLNSKNSETGTGISETHQGPFDLRYGPLTP
jgi:hypothetical protein